MALIKFKPTTPGRRFGSGANFSDLTTDHPYKPLTIPKRKSGGRNNHGHVTDRRISGGHKRRIRLIDFKRPKHNLAAQVLTIEYDPNRSARIALIQYPEGIKSYILAPDGLKVGESVMSGNEAEAKAGNHLPLRNIPEGTAIHNVELEPGRGGKLVRAGGTLATILAKEQDIAHVKLPSGEVRIFKLDAYATIGQCSNLDHENIMIGKAGRARWLGIKTQTRGVVQNPCDHPMGGGEGKSKGGNHPQSPWGQKAKGFKTRRPNKRSARFIVKDRRA